MTVLTFNINIWTGCGTDELKKGDWANSRREKENYHWGEGRSYWKGKGKINKIGRNREIRNF